ncbi:MAG: 50S ribosomal protein L28 [Chloroflexi bacterium]|nr:50S ribosomal protein L28 [Chloroflexota bacterium]
MAKCQICGKGPLSGNNVSHAMNHTKRRWQPNIQKATVYLQGQPQRVRICTRCLRSVHKAARS